MRDWIQRRSCFAATAAALAALSSSMQSGSRQSRSGRRGARARFSWHETALSRAWWCPAVGLGSFDWD